MNICFSIKSQIKKRLPIAYLVFKHYQYSYSLFCSGYFKYAGLLLEKFNGKVYGGPFAGMRYAKRAAGSMLIPKILGCYEEELHPWISDLLLKDYNAIINIGCAEGYYAIGFALKSTSHARIYAYDTNPIARKLCRRLARLNGVEDRIMIRGTCEPEILAAVISYRTLIICDCEGYEATILDPALVPGLSQCEMLVETHANSRDILRIRFLKTHTIDQVSSVYRDPDQYPLLNCLSVNKGRVIDECRGDVPQFWLLLRPRTTTSI